MSPRELVLNIAVNLDRISRFAMEGKQQRVKLFLKDSQSYLDELENSEISNKFQPTLDRFKNKFRELSQNIRLDEVWAEEALTWANILQHRAKLA